jgi:hypothetical protein
MARWQSWYVTGHIQSRQVRGQRVVEIVAEDVQYLRNIDWDRGKLAAKRLVNENSKCQPPVGIDLDNFEIHSVDVPGQG